MLNTFPEQKKTILIVDDSHAVRETVAVALAAEGYDVITAEHGKKALQLLMTQRPDLILSDLNMPVMGGFQLLEEIRSRPGLAPIPFIFLTSSDAQEDIQRGRTLGIEDYLIKPFDLHELVSVVNARLVRSMGIQLALIGQAYHETVNVLANTIEGRDAYTRGHVDRVTTYAGWFGSALGFNENQLKTLDYGARLHDIGKVLVPDQILNKKGKLTDAEWELIKQHPATGAQILRGVSLLRDTIPYVLYHHERWDGSGYPNGLKGKNIPIQGRLLAIVDVFDALTSTRSYRAAMNPYKALEFIGTYVGSHYDADLFPVFTKIIMSRLERSALAHDK